MESERPFLVGLVCWALIIAGMRGVYSTMKVLGTDAFRQSLSVLPYPVTVAQTILFVALVAMVVSGICMYERQGWARWIYLVALPPFFLQRFLIITTLQTLPDDQAEPQDPLAAIQAHLQTPPNQTKEELILAALVVLYLISLWILFTLTSRRFFHPPMYVDE